MSNEINFKYPKGGIFRSLESIPKAPHGNGMEIVKSILMDALGYIIDRNARHRESADIKIASLAHKLFTNNIIDKENVNHQELLKLVNFIERVLEDMNLYHEVFNEAMLLSISNNIISANTK